MILLDGANQKIQVVTDAAGDIEVQVSYADNNAGALTFSGSPLASIVTGTTTDIIAAVGASKQRAVKLINLRNNHASQTVNVTVQETDGTNTVSLMKCSLLAGEVLTCDELGNWTHFDNNGGQYPALGNLATQADMETGTSTSTVVTPGRVQYHPSAVKFWGLFDTAGATTIGYNVDAPTDNGTGDITVNITTDFSSANYCAQVSVEMTATTYAVANARTPHIRSGGQAAGSLRCDCIDGTATTQLVKDPTKWHISGCGDQA